MNLAGAIICVGLAACGSPSRTGCRLPAATGEYRQTDNTLVFVLPARDSGFYANGVRLEESQLAEQFAALFQQRRPGHRAVFVRETAPDRCEDLKTLANVAAQAGGAAFDAELSGWPREVPPPSE